MCTRRPGRSSPVALAVSAVVKSLVKGLLVTSGTVKRINLLTVIGLADTCG